MKVLLQQKETQLYLKDVNDWTAHPDEAMDFASSTRAIEFWEKHKTPNVHIVLKFQDQPHEIVLDAFADTNGAKGDKRHRATPQG